MSASLPSGVADPDGSAATEDAGAVPHSRAELVYRRALLAYPRRYRRERGEEIISTLLDAGADARAGAGAGATPATAVGRAGGPVDPPADVREVAALIVGGLRRRLGSDGVWWEGARWATVVAAALAVVASSAWLRASVEGPGEGWAAPGSPDDLASWLRAPAAVVVLGSVALLASVRAWVIPAWLAVVPLAVSALGPPGLDGWWSWLGLVGVVAAWLLGPLALAVRGPAAPRLPWRWSLTSIAAPLIVGGCGLDLHLCVWLTLAVVAAAAVVVPAVARGLALCMLTELVTSMAFGAGIIGRPEVTALMLLAAGWPALLGRVTASRVPGRRRSPLRTWWVGRA